jgi:hypothetical protein
LKGTSEVETKSQGVYYISKRALCSRSIAHQDLGIQPIAVSKLILRPVVQTEETDLFKDRLQVLEEGMINDVVFLDRNITSAEAELNANVCPLHTVSTLPARNPTRYTAKQVLFGVSMTVDEIPAALQHWRHWMNKHVSLHILVPSTDFYRVTETETLVRRETGAQVHVEAARDIDDEPTLYMMLTQNMHKRAQSKFEWFIVLTPNTFVTSVDDVLLALEPYDSMEKLYMGGLSESRRRKEQYGDFAYGGAGVVLSRPLLEALAPEGNHPPPITSR